MQYVIYFVTSNAHLKDIILDPPSPSCYKDGDRWNSLWEGARKENVISIGNTSKFMDDIIFYTLLFSFFKKNFIFMSLFSSILFLLNFQVPPQCN